MKILIETLGCPKNEVDSDKAADLLEKAGHELIDNPEEADMILVNTCGFIQDAKEESIQTIFEMAQYKNGNCKILMISGCLGQRYNRELFDQIPEADGIIGVNDYDQLPKLIQQIQEGKRIQQTSDWQNLFEKTEGLCGKVVNASAYLKIAEGCDNCCTYCIIPSIRGGYRSRREEDILAEAKLLSEKGAKEIVLIAQDVTGYGQDLYGELRLPELLRLLKEIQGIHWIRLMYCYPDKITEELVEEIRDNDKVCKYIDIPIQHANDDILSAMNRKSRKEDMIHVIEMLRQKIPHIAIRTTLITGFPGETKERFQELYNFIDEVKFDRMGVFAYSKEEGTPAALLKPQVRQDVKKRRREQLMQRQQAISLEKNMKKIGQTLEVLVEEGPDEDGVYYGRTMQDAREIDNAVIFTSKRRLRQNEFVQVKIKDAFDYDLTGEVIL